MWSHVTHVCILHVCGCFFHSWFKKNNKILDFAVSVWSLKLCLLFNSEWNDGGGEEASPPEGAGQSFERRSQASSDGAERRAADSEVSVNTSQTFCATSYTPVTFWNVTMCLPSWTLFGFFPTRIEFTQNQTRCAILHLLTSSTSYNIHTERCCHSL